MPLDAITISALCDELRPQLEGARIDKVQQPERDTLLLSLRSPGTSCRLLLSASSNHPRIHLTEEAMDTEFSGILYPQFFRLDRLFL